MSICSLLLGLLTTMCLQSCAMDYWQIIEQCCLSFVEKPVPLRHIKMYKKTLLQCPKPGVIFITHSAHRICADPDRGWVQWAINKIDHRFLEKVQSQPLPKLYTATDLHGEETEAPNKPVPKTLRPDPNTDIHRHETEAQTQPVPETLAPDPAKPNWFCQI